MKQYKETEKYSIIVYLPESGGERAGGDGAGGDGAGGDGAGGDGAGGDGAGGDGARLKKTKIDHNL